MSIRMSAGCRSCARRTPLHRSRPRWFG